MMLSKVRTYQNTSRALAQANKSVVQIQYIVLKIIYIDCI